MKERVSITKRTMERFCFSSIVAFLFLNIMPFLGGNGNLSLAQNSDTKDSIYEPKIDPSGCIYVEQGAGCSWDSICPSDTPLYNKVRLMMYVDSHLAENQRKAFQLACGTEAKILANDSVELFIFEFWYGASHEEMHAYYRKNNEKFRRLNFNSDEAWRGLKVLDEKNNGVRDITVSRVYSGQKFRLSFNGKNSFDTTHIGGIPYHERKKAGIGTKEMVDSSYNAGIGSKEMVDSSDYKNIDFKFLAEKKHLLDTLNYKNTLIYGFMKIKALDSQDYHFIGYFTSLPMDYHFEPGIGLDDKPFPLPVFRVISWPRNGRAWPGQERAWTVRFHYWDGKKYVGILIPQTVTQWKTYKDKDIKMHPKYHMEVLPDE